MVDHRKHSLSEGEASSEGEESTMAPTYTTSRSPSPVDGWASSWGAWLQGRWEMVLGILLCIAAAQAFEGGYYRQDNWTPSFQPDLGYDRHAPRLVALGDLHGDWDNALASLQLMGVADAEGHWMGGSTTLVQTGDQTDRGAHGAALSLLMGRMAREAEEAGGKVHVLVGNHELMNLQENFAYVDRREYEELGNGDAVQGADEYRSLFAAGGAVREALEARDVAVVAGEAGCRSLFVHAGLQPEILEAAGGLDAVNEAFRSLLRRTAVTTPRGGGGGLERALGGNQGPVWARNFSMQPEARICPLVEETLAAVGAARMVIGHTVQDRGMRTRCGGMLHLIDIGMSRAYNGVVGGWECGAAGVEAVVPGGRRALQRLK